MRIARWLATGVMGCVVVGVSLAGPGEAMAAKGGGGAVTTPGAPTGPCGTLTVANSPQTTRNLAISDIKYSVTNCGTSPLQGTVTITEGPGFLSDVCPSQTADPAPVTLPAGGKVSPSAFVFRGPCGWSTSQGGPIVQGYTAWQGHNLQLTLTDDASGAVLSVGYFSWQDAVSRP